MMMKDATPEERLLRLIKKKKPEPIQPKAEPGQSKADYIQPSQPIAPNSERERIEIAQEMPDRKTRAKAESPKAGGEAGKKSFIELAPKALVLLLVLSIIYLIADILLVTPYYRNRIKAVSSTPAGVEEAQDKEEAVSKEAADIEPTKPYSYYSKDIGSRDIFKPVVQDREGAVDRGQQGIKDKFSLIGVITGEELQAAIEDKTASKTYFVFKGDYIDDVLVEDILVNKVILDYRGERFELML